MGCESLRSSRVGGDREGKERRRGGEGWGGGPSSSIKATRALGLCRKRRGEGEAMRGGEGETKNTGKKGG